MMSLLKHVVCDDFLPKMILMGYLPSFAVGAQIGEDSGGHLRSWCRLVERMGRIGEIPVKDRAFAAKMVYVIAVDHCQQLWTSFIALDAGIGGWIRVSSALFWSLRCLVCSAGLRSFDGFLGLPLGFCFSRSVIARDSVHALRIAKSEAA